MGSIERILNGENIREVLLSEAAPKMSIEEVQQLDVDAIIPDQKDKDRADGLRWRGHTFHGDSSPWASEASKMAKLITDPYKLVRRAKAVVARWGTEDRGIDRDNVWQPFRNRLIDFGFTGDQIRKIANYRE